MLFLRSEDGQGLAEYALLIAFIALVVVLILGIFGQQLYQIYLDLVACLPDYNTGHGVCRFS